MPTKAYSASLHPNKSCFVIGGEDFKIYKFDYDDGKELGMCGFWGCFWLKAVNIVIVFQNLTRDILVQFIVCVIVPMERFIALVLKMELLDYGSILLGKHMVFGKVMNKFSFLCS